MRRLYYKWHLGGLDYCDVIHEIFICIENVTDVPPPFLKKNLRASISSAAQKITLSFSGSMAYGTACYNCHVVDMCRTRAKMREKGN